MSKGEYLVPIQVKLLTETAKLPEYKTAGAAGMDLVGLSKMNISPGETVLVKTGIAIAVPEGYEAQVRSRSGMAKMGIVVANSPGTIDSDYRGEVGVLIHNQSPGMAFLAPGDRIAQLVIAPVMRAEMILVDELDDTARGAGGFGSTGVREPTGVVEDLAKSTGL